MSPLILAAPAAFKGTLGPRQVAEALAAGVREALPEASVLQCPLSDGGDGLLDAVLPRGSLRERLKVTGPLGEPVSGELGWLDAETAIFESATACGIALLKPEDLDPLHASTRGVGELIWEAVERGAKTVVVGLGGSATVDGGTGAARGLGWTFRDAEGAVLPDGGGTLAPVAELSAGGAVEALVGKASGEVVRRAHAAKKRVAVVAGKVEGLIGLHALDGEGRMLDAAGIAALAGRAVRQAFGLPAA